jgi:hypothetical protein
MSYVLKESQEELEEIETVATQIYDVKAECGPWVFQVTGNFHNMCMGYLEVA